VLEAEPPAEKPVEDQLFEAMDREALRMIQTLDHGNIGPDGQSTVDADERLKIFKAGQEWLQRRAKLKPRKEEDGPEGVEAVMELLREVRAAVKKPARIPAKAGRDGEGAELAKVIGAKR